MDGRIAGWLDGWRDRGMGKGMDQRMDERTDGWVYEWFSGRVTQISAYIAHKDLAVRKIMHAMRTAYAKSRTRPRHVSNYTTRQKITEGTGVL